MITLIHGEDTTASRNYYFDTRQKIKDQKTIDGSTLSPTSLKEIVTTQDLFGNSPTFFLENLFSKRKSSKEIEEFATILINCPSEIVLWESKELTPKQTGLLKNATVKLFKIPSTIFALLDSIIPQNGKQLINEFHKTLQDKDAEFVLVMMQRQIRILLGLSEVNTEHISEVSRLAPWQKGKLEKQAKEFSIDELMMLHDKLFQLELGMKTGGLSQPLENEIDFLLMSL